MRTGNTVAELPDCFPWDFDPGETAHATSQVWFELTRDCGKRDPGFD